MQYAAARESNIVGPNAYGVPENLPFIPSDVGCSKCHGTGYKKTLLTRRWKACKKCAHKYGTDITKITIEEYPVMAAGTTSNVIGGGIIR